MRAMPAVAGLLLLAACSGPSILVPGESVREPDPPPPKVEVRVVAADDLGPVEGASFTVGDQVAATDSSGEATLEWLGSGIDGSVSAPGFVTAVLDLSRLPSETFDVILQPVILSGTVVTPDGAELAEAVVTVGSVEAITNASGEFVVPRAVAGTIEVSRPAWAPSTTPWDGAATRVTITMEPRIVRGLRVSGPAAGDSVQWNQLLDMAVQSAVNALVVDLKDESGTVFYNSSVEDARTSGAVQVFYELADVLAALDRRGLYAIGRIAVFQDSFLAAARPDLAAVDAETGGVWRNPAGEAWLDPTDRASWEYSLALAVEACDAGFDEIQFDFARFPSEGRLRALRYDAGDLDQEERLNAIVGYLDEARLRLRPSGCAVAVDMISIVLSARNDQGVGLRPEELSEAADVLSPTIYPALYGSGWLGFEDPNQFPSEVVGDALDSGLDRLTGTAIMRPWLQTFSYGPTEISIEINEAEERGLGWMLWSSASRFNPDSLPEESDLQ